MDRSIQQKKAETLFSLHTNGKLLILPNIWNPIGARILETKGYPAVATASAAVSSSLGYADGEMIKRSTLMDILSRIARSVNIPVTADIESGYGETLSELEETIRQVLDCGIVGINIEDSPKEEGTLRPVKEQCERIAAVRRIADAQGIHLVINARIDTFLSNSFPSTELKIEETVSRAEAYTRAGADCLFPVGPGDIDTVKKLRSRIAAPLNIIASRKATSLTLLQEIGINRVSFGPFIFRSCMKKFADIADALQSYKGYDCFGENMMSKSDAELFLIHEPEE